MADAPAAVGGGDPPPAVSGPAGRRPSPASLFASLRVRLLLLVAAALLPAYGLVFHAALEMRRTAGPPAGAPAEVAAAAAASEADLLRNLLLVSLVAVLALGASWIFGSRFLTDRVNGLLSATRRLASGDLRARRGGRPARAGELGMLEQAFDEMAVSLEIRSHELHRAEARYREIVEMIPAVFFTGRVEEGILPEFVSPQIRGLAGFSPEEWTKEPSLWDSRVDPADAERVRRERLAGLRAGAGYDIEYRLRAAAGTTVWVKERGVSFGSHGPGALWVRGFLSDVTARKALERQFLQSQKMEAVGRLAAGVAHDFNNLLTVIGGYSQLLQLRVEKDPTVQGQLEEIRRAADRAAVLTRQLLHFSRRQEADPVVLDLDEALSSLDRMVRRLLGDGIRVVTDPSPRPVRILIDRGHLDQVVMNLVVNARDAMPEGGTLTLRTAREALGEEEAAALHGDRPGPFAVLEVEDTGCGMDEATRERIFEPFFTTKGEGKGTGLGLSTVYAIVQQARGVVEVRSAPGLGTTFRVLLPLHEGEVAGPKAAAPVETPSSRTLGVLLVEDEASIRGLTREFLLRDGHRVREAACLEEARRALAAAAGEIDLLLVDVSLPDGDGGRFATEAVACHPRMRVILTSGYSPASLREEGKRSEGMRFLQKPYRSAQLREAIEEVLAEVRGAEAGT